MSLFLCFFFPPDPRTKTIEGTFAVVPVLVILIPIIAYLWLFRRKRIKEWLQPSYKIPDAVSTNKYPSVCLSSRLPQACWSLSEIFWYCIFKRHFHHSVVVLSQVIMEASDLSRIQISTNSPTEELHDIASIELRGQWLNLTFLFNLTFYKLPIVVIGLIRKKNIVTTGLLGYRKIANHIISRNILKFRWTHFITHIRTLLIWIYHISCWTFLHLETSEWLWLNFHCKSKLPNVQSLPRIQMCCH